MRKTIFYKLIRNKRVGGAIIGNGLVSLASLFVSIAVARGTSVAEFGAFSIALVAYLFSSGLIRSALTDNVLSRPDDAKEYRYTSQRISLVSIFAGLVLVIFGLVSKNHFLIVLGFSIHGLLSLDFLRTFHSAAGSSSYALVPTAAWSTISLALSFIGILTSFAPLFVFGGWSMSGAIIGYVAAFKAGITQIPKWKHDRTVTRNSLVFGADYLIGAGGTQLTTGLLGFVSDIRVLGAVRGAGTILGPMNLISTTARSLMLPFLSRRMDNPDHQFKSAIQVTSLQVLLLTPLLLVLQFIPDSIGTQLLGETWELAKLAILPMSIDSVFALIAAVAISAHRVAFAGTRTIFLRLATGVIRPAVVLYCAFYWGISGAAWAMAAFAVLSSIIWWISFYDLNRRSRESSKTD